MHLLVQPIGSAAPVRINLQELAHVRRHHMPPAVVRFAEPAQLERVADEVARREPRYREEAAFVRYDELRRRARLATPVLQAVKGGPDRG